MEIQGQGRGKRNEKLRESNYFLGPLLDQHQKKFNELSVVRGPHEEQRGGGGEENRGGLLKKTIGLFGGSGSTDAWLKNINRGLPDKKRVG